MIIERALVGKFSLIAEIGVNHFDIATSMGVAPLEAAKEMIQQAHLAGVHAVKFQSYTASKLASTQSPAYWDQTEEPTASQFELFQRFDKFGFNEFAELSTFCRELGIEFLSTAFDYDAADYLEALMDVYKVSSSDLSNLPFIRYQATKGKPMIMSVGASTESEIRSAVECIRSVNHEPLIVMHCVLEYPTPYEHANLNRIRRLADMLPDCLIGYSDHTRPDPNGDVLKTAYTLGAVAIEKHFTLDKSLPGNDHYHAMDPSDAALIVSGMEFIETVRGDYQIAVLPSEERSRANARRSLVAAVDLAAGAILSREVLVAKRPGTGISPARLEEIVGRRTRVPIAAETVLQDEMLE